MSEDIGPGDVLEHIESRARYVVEEVVLGQSDYCIDCGQSPAYGFHFVNKTRFERPHCPNHWRKIGPSRSETVSRFAHHLTGGKVDA